MASVPQLEAEPRSAAAQFSLVNVDSLPDPSHRRTGIQNVVTTISSSYDRTARFTTPQIQSTNVNPLPPSYDMDNVSRQTSVSHISNGSYSANISNAVSPNNIHLENIQRNKHNSTSKTQSHPMYSPYPTTSMASTTIYNPQREVVIKTPSVHSKDRTKSSHSTNQNLSSFHSKTSKDTLTSVPPKRNRLQEALESIRKSQRVLCGLCCILFVTAIIAAVILCAIFIPNYQKTFSFQWAPPATIKQTGAVEASIINLTIDDDNNQARFDMTGRVPFKANYVSVYDFKTNKAIIYDPSLKNGTKTLYCFVMTFATDKLKNIDGLRKAAQNSQSLTSQTTGWGEQWHYVPQNLNNVLQLNYVNPGIPECNGARLIELKSVGANQKNLKCTDCFDFCFPEYGIETDLIQNQSKLNIANRLCFYFFVPEWQSFAQGYNTNNPQYSTYQTNGNIQNTAYSPNPSLQGNYVNNQYGGQQQSTLYNGNQNGQRTMVQGYNNNNNNNQFTNNPQQFNHQQKYANLYNGNGHSNNYNNGINTEQTVPSQYNNNQQITSNGQYNNGQHTVFARDNNTHPESKWIPVSNSNNNNGFVNQVANTTSNLWSNAQGALNTGVDALQNVQETLGRGIQNTGRGIQSVGGGFQRFGGNIESGISDLRQTISSGIDNVGQGLQNFGQNTGNNLQNYAQNVGNNLQTMGQNVQQGFQDGVNSAQNGVENIHEQMAAQFNRLKQQTSGESSYYPSYTNNNQNNGQYSVRGELNGQQSLSNNNGYYPTSQIDTSGQSLNNNNNNLSPGMAQYTQSNHNLRNPMIAF
uniref:BRICHOS domain-containing protein n=1 Tax=Parastrongyloides trichosuri TaxID=131310 RepID=A0A0N4ZTK3_PARTI